MCVLEEYIHLIFDFVSSRITAYQFEDCFINLWYKTNWESMSIPVQKIIGDLSLWIDGFSDDPEIFPNTHIDEETLKKHAHFAYESLIPHLKK
jgi:hypothetical protein